MISCQQGLDRGHHSQRLRPHGGGSKYTISNYKVQQPLQQLSSNVSFSGKDFGQSQTTAVHTALNRQQINVQSGDLTKETYSNYGSKRALRNDHSFLAPIA